MRELDILSVQQILRFITLALQQREKKNFQLNKGSNLFIRKWGIPPIILRKFYLETGKNFEIRNKLKKNLFYYFYILKYKFKSYFKV